MTNPRVDPDDVHILYTAAVVGAPYLALQLERLGISDPAESLDDARHLRRDLLATVDRLKRDPSG
jgi:hypothetical protein